MTPTPQKTGRPRLKIDPNEVYRLAKVGCSDSEIGSLLGCDPQTISRRFSGETTKGRMTLKRRLRRKQLELALKGDRTMLIWLGKQMLDQREPSPLIAIQNNLVSQAAAEEMTIPELIRQWEDDCRQKLGLPPSKSDPRTG